MITAETITDEQIRELQKDGTQYERAICHIALCEGSRRDHAGALIDERARARLAEILNARTGES